MDRVQVNNKIDVGISMNLLPSILETNNGIVTVSGQHFRPSYFVTMPDAETVAFWMQHKDSHGLAYRAVQANADGIRDIEVLTEDGVQVVYGR